MLFLNLKRNRRLVLLALVYGCYLSCTSIVTWGAYNYFLEGDVEGSLFLYEHFARGLAFPAALLLAGVLAFLNPKNQRWRSPSICMIFFILGGMLAIIQQYATGASMTTSTSFVTGASQHMITIASESQSMYSFFAPFALILAGACFGWGGGILCCSLQEALASLKVYEAGYVVFGGSAFSAFLYLMLGTIPDTPEKQLFYFFVLIPFTAAVVQFTCDREAKMQKHPMFVSVPRLKLERCFQALMELWRPLICVSASAFTVGVVRVMSTVDSTLYLITNNTYMVGMIISSFALLIGWQRIYERLRLSRIHQLLFPITALTLLLLPLLSGSSRDISLSVTLIVYSTMSSLMVVSCLRAARNQNIHPVMVYGLFSGVVYLFCMIGSVVGFMAGLTANTPSVSLLWVALLTLFVLSLIINTNVKDLELTTSKLERLLTPNEPIPSIDATMAAMQAEDDFIARCMTVCDQYKLSRREADVLAFLAKGRDVPYIAEELVISKNTVRTHSKNIFSKTNVHSRQELIDLVECTEI